MTRLWRENAKIGLQILLRRAERCSTRRNASQSGRSKSVVLSLESMESVVNVKTAESKEA